MALRPLKQIFGSLFVTVGMMSALVVVPTHATTAYAVTAADLIKAVETKYKSVAGLRASFTQISRNAVFGDETVTGMAVANGSAWLVGSAGKDLEGQATVGEKDGFVAQIDVATGGVSWSQRLTGKDGYATPTSISVDQVGAGSLDRFGLPKGGFLADTVPDVDVGIAVAVVSAVTLALLGGATLVISKSQFGFGKA